MTDSDVPGRSVDAPGDGDAEPDLVRADDGGRQVALNAERVILPVGIEVERLRIRATGTAVGWTLLVCSVAAVLLSLAWLARTT